jgi:cytochrome c biogenesis protein CcdA
MEVLVALSCYTLYIENRKNLEVVRMNNQRPMFINILLVVLLFLIVGSLFSAVVGIVGSLLWLAVKILVPVAIIVWLVRTISGNNGNCRRRY